MERIVIELDYPLAKAWQNSSEDLRAKYYDKIVAVLKEMQKDRLKELMDEAGVMAEKNGMTEEILEKLLNEKD